MNRTHFIAIVGFAAALLLAFGAYRLGTQRAASRIDISPAEQGAPQRIDPATGRRVLYWHDPMVPGQRFDKPGKSPFMDMQLVPVYADDAPASAAGVTIDPRVQQRLGVRTANVTKGVLAASLSAVGNVEYNERDVAVVQARANGFVERVHARTPLQPVTRGQALADLLVPEWVAAQEEFLAVQRMESSARESLLAAARQRMRLVGMSDAHIDAVEQSGAVQPRLTVRAPIAGVISELLAREGMAVSEGAALFRINGLDSVWVYAAVPEAQLGRLRAGIKVKANATAFPEMSFDGVVVAVLPEVAQETRTGRARIELRNRKRLLVPGMFVTVQFEEVSNEPALLVPNEAVIVTGTRRVVILAEDGGRFRPVPVVTGREGNDMIEVLSGLEEGQRVVVSAQFLIDSEANLKAATERMTADDGRSRAAAQAQDHGGHK